MKALLAAILLLASTGVAFAQSALPTPSVSDLSQQLQEVGCKAERQAAVQTIVQLRAQIDALKKTNGEKDPPTPKSGATKH